MNGLYEACCILFVFPVIVSMGAGGKVTGKRSTAVCKFLGCLLYTSGIRLDADDAHYVDFAGR